MSTSHYQTVTERILDQLKAGTAPWRKSWTGGATLGQSRNMLSQAPYRGINAFTTALSGYRSPWFLTAKQGESIKATVKPDERGTPIVFYMPCTIADKKDPTKTRSVPMIRLYTVFNAEQFDNLRINESVLYPDKIRQNEFKRIASCEAIVSGYAGPSVVHREQRAYYSPMLDSVNMPVRESFTSSEEYYAVLFHELGHSTGHGSRLGRKTLTDQNKFGSHEYSKEELVAEMTAAFLCAETQIDQATISNSAAYIASWLKVLRGDPALVCQAAAQAQKAADLILNRGQS